MIRTNLKKISLSMALFRQWAQAKGLKPSETRYVRRDRGETVDLRFSKSGNPHVERSYRTHFVSPELSERKKAKLEERLSRAPERVVLQILGASRCSECGIELEQGGLLCMEVNQPLCLACAGLARGLDRARRNGAPDDVWSSSAAKNWSTSWSDWAENCRRDRGRVNTPKRCRSVPRPCRAVCRPRRRKLLKVVYWACCSTSMPPGGLAIGGTRATCEVEELRFVLFQQDTAG